MFAPKVRIAIAFAFIIAAAAPAKAGRPTLFDTMEYLEHLREQSPTPHLHPWLAATIKGVDISKRRIAFVHVPDASFGMAEMAMTLSVASQVRIPRLHVGDLVEMQIDSHGGVVQIIGLKRRR